MKDFVELARCEYRLGAIVDNSRRTCYAKIVARRKKVAERICKTSWSPSQKAGRRLSIVAIRVSEPLIADDIGASGHVTSNLLN